MKLQSEFSRESLKTIFARLPPLASAARCGPHPPHLLATPLVACLSVCLLDTRVSPTKTAEPIDSCGLGWAQRTTWGEAPIAPWEGAILGVVPHQRCIVTAGAPNTAPQTIQHIHRVSKNNVNVGGFSCDVYQPILIIFGRNVHERECYQMIVLFPTSSN